jgi:hypothetical protein
VGELESRYEVLLRQLERAAFDHDDRLLGAGHDEVDVGELKLLECRIEYPLAVQPADSDRGDRIRERHARDVERR